MAVSELQLQQLYLAYFGRPADFDGLVYYTTNPNITDIWQVATFFSESPESQALYGTGFNASVINSIYQNLFNRDAEPDGLLYWSQEVAAGRLTAAGAAYGILLGAQNDDAIAVANKLAAAAAFTAALDTAPEITGYAGDLAAAAARAWLHTVDSTATSLETALANVDATVAAVTNGGVISGETLTLTDGMDNFVITTNNTADVVKGFLDGTNDTLTVGDTITGNGHTILQVAADAGGGAVTAPYFEGSGIEKLHVVAAGTGWAYFDAANMGTDLTDISLAGTDGLGVSVTNLSSTGDISLSISAGTTGTICASGALNGATVCGCVWNSDTDTAGASMSVGWSGIDVALGGSDCAWVSLTDNQGGTLGIGGINATLAGNFQFYVANSVSKTGTGGTATVGDLNVGAINVDVSAAGGLFCGSFCNYAHTVKGAATVGNVTIGDVDVHVAKGGDQTWWAACNTADSDKGSATAGNLTVGNVTVTADKGAGYAMYTSLYNMAYANTGNATVGNMTIGNVTLNGADAVASGQWFGGEEYACVGGAGNATVGSMLVGDVNLTLGNNAVGTSDSACACFAMYASADKGSATVGDLTIGALTLNAGDNNCVCVTVCASAYVSSAGSATVGDVTIGNITADVGLSATAAVMVCVNANGEGTAAVDSVGNFTVGNVDIYGSADAQVSLCMCVYADNGGVGNVTVGSVDMYVENDASVSMLLCVSADSVGDLTVGNVNLTLGTSASVDTFCISVYAGDGNIGNITLGDMTVTSAKCAYDDDASNCFYACGDIGNVHVGNITVNAGISASFTSMLDFCFSADNGGIGDVTFGDITFTAAKSGTITQYIGITAEDGAGDITLGDVNMTGATNACVSMCLCLWASDDIGNVTVGDLTASAAKSGTAYICASLDNSGDWGDITVGDINATAAKAGYAWVGLDYSSDCSHDVGNIVVGSVDAHASGKGAIACASLSFTSFENVGTVTIGDIGASASGAGARQWIDIDACADQDMGAVVVGDVSIAETGGATGTNWAGVSLSFCAGDQMGTVTIGDVGMTLANATSSTVAAYGYFCLSVGATSGGNTTIGDITVSAAEVGSGTAGYVFESAYQCADFSISTDGNLVIGDITVADGGYEGYSSTLDATGAVLDNLGTLTSWLSLSVGAGKTITVGNVDYSGYQGAATIDVSGWKGAGVINAAQGDTTITDNKTKNVITLAGGDDTVNLNAAATTDESGEANIDEIIAFTHAKDTIAIDNATGAASTFAFKTAGLADYAAFLAWAATALATDDVAVGIVNGNTYVAFDNDNGHTIDFAIKLTGVTNVDETDFNII